MRKVLNVTVGGGAAERSQIIGCVFLKMHQAEFGIVIN
jgi:hypothetical protein